MREIKFRYVFQKTNEIRMAVMDIDLFELNQWGDIPVWENNGFVLVSRDQYTGLKDRNGKEIYEGDIVEVIEMPCSPDEVNFTAKIIYRDGSFWMEEESIPEIPLHGITYEPYTNGYRPLVCKVIGNIYENRELIEPKEDEK